MGREELGMEGVEGEEGAGNGAVRGNFRDLLLRAKPGREKSRHFSQWSGEIGRFLMIDENRGARPCCQFQRGRADFAAPSLGSCGLNRRRIQGIRLEPEGRSRGRVCVLSSVSFRLCGDASLFPIRSRGKAVRRG